MLGPIEVALLENRKWSALQKASNSRASQASDVSSAVSMAMGIVVASGIASSVTQSGLAWPGLACLGVVCVDFVCLGIQGLRPSQSSVRFHALLWSASLLCSVYNLRMLTHAPLGPQHRGYSSPFKIVTLRQQFLGFGLSAANPQAPPSILKCIVAI